MAYSSKYSFELWTKSGQLLADLSGKDAGAQDRSFTRSRNQPEDIEFSLDLNGFEKYCLALGIDPKQILLVNSTELRIKRYGEYIIGGQLMYTNVSISATDMKVSCRVFGFLALFGKRYTGTTTAGFISEVYTAANSTALSRPALAGTLITATQALTNGDFGITIGTLGGSATTYDKTYSRTNVMNALQDMTNLQTDPIDIEFTYNKVFNTYAQIGSNRPDIVFEFPGNITSLEVPNDGTDMTNEVIGLAQGSADGTQVTYFAEDIGSQTTFALRQDIYQSNATDNSDNGLTDGANSELVAKSNPIRVPAITVNGNLAPFVTDYGIGDYVQVKITGHPLIDDINGMYRVEKMTVDIDNDDNETVTLQVS